MVQIISQTYLGYLALFLDSNNYLRGLNKNLKIR